MYNFNSIILIYIVYLKKKHKLLEFYGMLNVKIVVLL